MMSDENKQVAKTFAYQTGAGIPAHAVGAVLGGYAGHNLEAKGMTLAGKMGRFGKYTGLAEKGGSKAVGAAIGMGAAGAIADLATLKHSLHGKVKQT